MVVSLKYQAPHKQTKTTTESRMKNQRFADSEPEEDAEDDDELREESRPRKRQNLGSRRPGPSRVSDEYTEDPGRSEAQ